MASALIDLFYSLTSCLSCFPGTSPNLRINNSSYKILRLLGEGGFSYVYLVEDTSTHQLYALKKIRCPFGQESVSQALKEVEAYSLFSPHPNIIHSIDHSVASDRGDDPGAKTVYILLPYYRRGNLQDMINANLVQRTRSPERRLMILFLGVCRALKAMHQYKVGGSRGESRARKVRTQGGRADVEAAEEVSRMGGKGKGKGRALPQEDDDDEQDQPLMENEISAAQEGVAPGQVRAYAHRDIKPGNIMIADDGLTPILMDLGSLSPSPTPVTSRSQALEVQDQAAEHSTMPYRAPELFDVKTNTIIDTKVDIWSLGCTLYACLVGKSPFEARSEETGGSLSLCVLGGDWRFPDEGGIGDGSQGRERGAKRVPTGHLAAGKPKEEVISKEVKDVVRRCLALEPGERPDVDELIEIVEGVVASLPDDGSE